MDPKVKIEFVDTDDGSVVDSLDDENHCEDLLLLIKNCNRNKVGFIWKWEDSPEFLSSICNTGGDEDYLILFGDSEICSLDTTVLNRDKLYSEIDIYRNNGIIGTVFTVRHS